MLRFLFTPRWIALFVAVCIIGVGCFFLGRWQFSRYDDRVASNATTEQNLSDQPQRVTGVMAVNRPLSADREWTHVEIRGRYDAPRQLAVLYRTLNDQPGVNQVVPFVTTDGTAVLVNRGWVASDRTADVPAMPAPPRGTVTIEGWTRVSSTSNDGDVRPNNGTVRAISSDAIAPTVPYPLYNGFVDLVKERPAPTRAPEPPPGPDLSTGPHFFYGIQWWFFALLAFGFWGYFAHAEYRDTVAKLRADRATPDPPEAGS